MKEMLHKLSVSLYTYENIKTQVLLFTGINVLFYIGQRSNTIYKNIVICVLTASDNTAVTVVAVVLAVIVLVLTTMLIVGYIWYRRRLMENLLKKVCLRTK